MFIPVVEQSNIFRRFSFVCLASRSPIVPLCYRFCLNESNITYFLLNKEYFTVASKPQLFSAFSSDSQKVSIHIGCIWHAVLKKRNLSNNKYSVVLSGGNARDANYYPYYSFSCLTNYSVFAFITDIKYQIKHADELLSTCFNVIDRCIFAMHLCAPQYECHSRVVCSVSCDISFLSTAQRFRTKVSSIH